MMPAVLQDVDLMPSHIVPSLTHDTEHNDVYSAYNKPGAVMYWLRVSLFTLTSYLNFA